MFRLNQMVTRTPRQHALKVLLVVRLGMGCIRTIKNPNLNLRQSLSTGRSLWETDGCTSAILGGLTGIKCGKTFCQQSPQALRARKEGLKTKSHNITNPLPGQLESDLAWQGTVVPPLLRSSNYEGVGGGSHGGEVFLNPKP